MTNSFPKHLEPNEIFFHEKEEKVYKYLGARNPNTLELLPNDQQWEDITHLFTNFDIFRGTN